jgi:hypothetical protein
MPSPQTTKGARAISALRITLPSACRISSSLVVAFCVGYEMDTHVTYFMVFFAALALAPLVPKLGLGTHLSLKLRFAAAGNRARTSAFPNRARERGTSL